jgi:DNA-3-methyladenine glycosylase I
MPNAQPKRCTWVNVDQVLMREYHDREWGVPTHDDRTHFEFLILEAAQAGLSWSIVLNKRDGYRRAFRDFNPEKVARYSAARIEKLTADPGIIRNRTKIRRRGEKRACVSGRAGSTRQLRRVLLAIRRRPPTTESMENDASDPCHHARVRCLQQRPQAARLQLRRIHRDLRPHAGSRDGERSLDRLFPISRRSAARHPRRMSPTTRRWSEAQMTNVTRLFKNECGSRS